MFGLVSKSSVTIGKVSARAWIRPSLEINIGGDASQCLPVECLPFFMPLSLEESGQRTCAIATHRSASTGIAWCDPRAQASTESHECPARVSQAQLEKAPPPACDGAGDAASYGRLSDTSPHTPPATATVGASQPEAIPFKIQTADVIQRVHCPQNRMPPRKPTSCL